MFPVGVPNVARVRGKWARGRPEAESDQQPLQAKMKGKRRRFSGRRRDRGQRLENGRKLQIGWLQFRLANIPAHADNLDGRGAADRRGVGGGSPRTRGRAALVGAADRGAGAKRVNSMAHVRARRHDRQQQHGQQCDTSLHHHPTLIISRQLRKSPNRGGGNGFTTASGCGQAWRIWRRRARPPPATTRCPRSFQQTRPRSSPGRTRAWPAPRRPDPS